MGAAQEGVTYPREVPILEGMPEGWQGFERMYQTGKYQGKTYTRWNSLDGRHKHVISPSKVIEIDAQEKGYDAVKAIEVYFQKQKERHEREAGLRELERVDKGRLKGEMREAAIKCFTDKYGPLRGPLVHAFKGWRTRWDYMPNSKQVHVTYTDTEGNEWKLLKDLEACFGKRVQDGEDFTDFLEEAKAMENAEMFRHSSTTCRDTQSTYESSAYDGVTDAPAPPRPPSKKAGVVQLPADEKYEEAPLVVAACPENGAGPSADGPSVGRVRALLTDRGFSPAHGLARVSLQGGGDRPAEPANSIVQALCGIYFLTGHSFHDRPCYQWVAEAEAGGGQLLCSGLYLSWAGERQKRWRLGGLSPHSAGFAYCEDDALSPFALKKPWMVLRRDAAGANDGQPQERDRSRSRSPTREIG